MAEPVRFEALIVYNDPGRELTAQSTHLIFVSRPRSHPDVGEQVRRAGDDTGGDGQPRVHGEHNGPLQCCQRVTAALAFY